MLTSTTPAACAGVTAVTVVEVITLTLVAAVPPKVTLVVPARPVPVKVTPTPPDVVPVLGETTDKLLPDSIVMLAVMELVLLP